MKLLQVEIRGFEIVGSNLQDYPQNLNQKKIPKTLYWSKNALND